MNFLKNLFGGGNQDGGDRGMYFYVQPKRCDEIVQVRIDPMNDLSQSEEGDGYVVRKMVSAIRCPFQAEMTVHYDKNRKPTRVDVENGEQVDEAAYKAWEDSRAS